MKDEMKLLWNDVLRNFRILFDEKIPVIQKLNQCEIRFRLLNDKILIRHCTDDKVKLNNLPHTRIWC
jgi:hypothetical protein